MSSRVSTWTALAAAALMMTAVACDADRGPANGPFPPNTDDGNFAIDPNQGAAGDGDYTPPPAVADCGDEVDPSGETCAEWVENDWVDASEEPVSTFRADVDTASYSLARRNLNAGLLPEPASVRVEEFLTYFKYAEPPPQGEHPFGVQLEVAPSPFAPADEQLHLMRIGIQGEEIPYEEHAPVNLVFLIDVSGSMTSAAKLPLVKYTLGLLVDKLAPTDTLGIVVYAGADGVVLEPTAVENKSVILDAIDDLRSGGSTNGEAGIRTAYDMTESVFREDGVNRVVLASDGDFNVGLTGEPLYQLIEEFRDRDIFLTYFGYGSGNYNDATAEELTNRGNGNYAYIDSNNEALRVVGENLVGTLQVIAKDVKLQAEFDPARVARYRLIGYENRLLNPEDFVDDSVDAGDLGAGHHVAALNELELHAEAKAALAAGTAAADPIATLRIRYKKPNGDESTELSHVVDLNQPFADAANTSLSFKWAVAIAELAEICRGSAHVTALYEVELVDAAKAAVDSGNAAPDLMATLRIRYKARAGRDYGLSVDCADDEPLLFPELTTFQDATDPAAFDVDVVAAVLAPSMLAVVAPEDIPGPAEDWASFAASIGTDPYFQIIGPHLVDEGRLGVYLLEGGRDRLLHGGRGFWFRWTPTGWRVDGRFCSWVF